MPRYSEAWRMSMTSRTSGTSRLERTAELRMVSSGRYGNLRRDSGKPAGTFVYNAVSWGISRVFRHLQDFHRLWVCQFGRFPENVPAKSAARWGAHKTCPKNLGCYAGWCTTGLNSGRRGDAE